MFANPLPAHAASLTWDGGGADNNWSTCANWTTDTCPIAGDTVTFNATSTKNSTIDAGAPASVATLTIAAGYTGTITLARTFATTTTFSQATGSFTASNQSLTMAAFTLSGGTFTASSGTTTVSGAVTVSGTPTFNHNSGTVTFSGGAATIACNGISLNTATFTNTGLKTISSGCTIPMGASPTIANAVTVNGTLSGSGTLTITTGTFLLGTTGSLSGFTGISAGSNLTINGTLNASSYLPFSVTGAFALGGTATFTAPSGTLSAGSLNFTLGPIFNANSGTIDFTGGSSSSVCGNAVFNLVTFHNTATKTIGSDCALPLGNNPTISNAITLNGTFTGSGTLTTTTGGFTIGTTGVLSGFSGISTGAALTINGTLNAGSYSTFTSVGAFTLGAASVFTAPSGSMSLQGSVTFTAGMTFNANGGTVNLIGSSGTISCANATFNLVSISAGTNTKTINSDCNLPLGNNPSITRVVLNGTLSGTGTLTHTTSTFQLNAGATLSGFTGLQDNVSLIIAGANLDVSTYSTFNVAAIQMTSGSLTAPPGIMNVSANLTFTGGVFNANGGTTNFYSSTSASVACNNAVFNHVTLNKSNVITIGSDCSLPLGNNPTITNSVNVNGTLTGTGTLTAAILTLNAGSNLSGFTGIEVNYLTISGATYDASTYSLFNVSGGYIQTGGFVTLPSAGASFFNFNLNAGSTLTASTGVISIEGNFTTAAGSIFNANGGTITFVGTNSQILGCYGTVFNSVVINKFSGDMFINSLCNLPLGSNPTVYIGGTLFLNGQLSGAGTLSNSSGTLTILSSAELSGFTGLNVNNLTLDEANADFGTYNTLDINGTLWVSTNSTFKATSAIMTISGWLLLDSGSTFDANNGTVILDGNNQQINGSIMFYDLTKHIASTDTLTFSAGSTQTILGALSFKGTDTDNLLNLVSSSPGTPWQIDAQGTRTLQYLNVSDSTNINPGVMIAYDSINSGNNTNWSFQSTPVPPTPTPTPDNPSSSTVTNNTNGYVLHPADAIEGSVTIVDSNNNNPDNAGRKPNKNPNQTYTFIWWSSIIGILLLTALLAYILYVTDKKNHHT